MTLSKTGVLVTILLFFVLLSTIVGLYKSSNGETYTEIDGTEISVGENYGFSKNIILGYAELPVALNVIIFGILGTTLLFIGVTSLVPTLNGGN